jgi:hypothetical protein
VERQATEALMQVCAHACSSAFFPANWNGHSDRDTVLLMGARARTMSPNIATNAIGTNSNQVIAGAHVAAQSHSFCSGQAYRKIRSCEMAMSISLFLHATVRRKLRKIGPKVIHLLLVLNAREDHFCAWNHPLWVLDVFSESRLIPNNSRIVICV